MYFYLIFKNVKILNNLRELLNYKIEKKIFKTVDISNNFEDNS